MVRANQVYTRHTLRDEGLNSLVTLHTAESTEDRILRGLRQSDKLLRSVLRRERTPAETLALMSQQDISSLVAMQVLQYLPAHTPIVDALQALYDVIGERAEDMARDMEPVEPSALDDDRTHDARERAIWRAR